MQIINSSARRIGWAIKTTNMKRLGVDPPCGVLDPKESTLMAVSCDAFAYGQEVREIGDFSNPRHQHITTTTNKVYISMLNLTNQN